MGDGICLFIQLVTVRPFVDAHAPEDHTGVVTVAFDHVRHVFQAVLAPFALSGELPARHLGKHEQADFIAAIEEVRGIRVVRRARKVAAELKF